MDMALTAVRIAQHVDGPVKITWSREQDLRQDIFRPCYRNLIDASLADGKLAALDYKVCGSSILARWAPPFFQNGIDGDAIDSAADSPYDLPHLRVAYLRVEPPAITTGWWRGAGCNNNVFAIESFMDECARKVGKDPSRSSRDARKVAASASRARPGGGEVELGKAAAGTCRSRHLRPTVVRQLHGDGGRG